MGDEKYYGSQETRQITFSIVCLLPDKSTKEKVISSLTGKRHFEKYDMQ